MLFIIIVTTLIISIRGFKNLSFFNKYKFNVGSIIKGDNYRMFSSGFLHVDYNHLFFNLLLYLYFQLQF